MAIRLIVMDLDGTLLTSEKMVSDYSKDVLRRAMEKGVAVTLATGRMLLSASYFGRIIGANAPIISCNGALVQALDATEPLFLRAFPPETVAELLTFARENGWYAQWYIGDDIYAEDFRPEYFTAYRTVQGFAVHEVGEDFSPYVEGVAQVVVRDLAGGVGAIAASIRERFAGRVDPQQSKGYTLDLVPTGVSKATGIEAILRATGIRADEVMACGDSDNDLSMRRLAGTSVVTANGQEEAKALATYLAPSCDEDGVARAIEELVL